MQKQKQKQMQHDTTQPQTQTQTQPKREPAWNGKWGFAGLKAYFRQQFVVDKAVWLQLATAEAEAYRRSCLLRVMCLLMALFTQLDNVANLLVLAEAFAKNKAGFDFATEVAFDTMEQLLIGVLVWAALGRVIRPQNYRKAAIALITGGFLLTSYAYLGTTNFLPLLYYYIVLCAIVVIILDKRWVFVAASFATMFLTGLRLENIRLGQNLVEAGIAYSLMGITVVVLILWIPIHSQVELLLAKNWQLEELRRQGLELQEQERQRLARELHDESLALINRLRTTLQDKAIITGQELASLRTLADEVESSVRGITRNLHAPELDICPLYIAIGSLALTECKQAGLALNLELDDELAGQRFARQIENTLYRVVQQGLANTIRHARASAVELRLAWDKAQERLALELADNGAGFELPTGGNLKLLKQKNHFGVAGFAERVMSVSGKFQIITSPGRGTRLVASVPALPELDEAQL